MAGRAIVEAIIRSAMLGWVSCGKSLHRKDRRRETDLELDDRHAVRLRWGCDARYLAIEVTDPLGNEVPSR